MPDNAIWAIPIMFCMLIIFVAGMFCGSPKFDFNTRDCTIACPGNAESIQYRGECYCKLEGK